MSMTRCDYCEDLIDSDDDPDCFLSDDSVACIRCRDRMVLMGEERGQSTDFKEIRE